MSSEIPFSTGQFWAISTAKTILSEHFPFAVILMGVEPVDGVPQSQYYQISIGHPIACEGILARAAVDYIDRINGGPGDPSGESKP